MSGSSRSLLKALALAFETWNNDVDWRSCPPALVKNLYDVIFAYTDRHNSTYNLSTTINDELRAIYNNHIHSSDQLGKEIFFLDLLVRLLPLLSDLDLKLWLQTYLRPTLDTAGFDLEFVNKCKEFVNVLIDDSFTSEDPALVQSREEMSQFVMKRILQLYVAKSHEVYKVIGLSFTEAERSTQIHTERIRFLERNCALLIESWCLLRPKTCFTLLNEFFLDPDCRLKVMALLSMLASCKNSQVQYVVDTPLYVNLLRSLSFDTSEAILGSGLGIVLMLMGKVCDKVFAFLPDLFVIYSRLLLWIIKRIMDDKSVDRYQWAVVRLNTNGSLMSFQLYSEDKFNVTYYLTLLYGLFPCNLVEFLRSPGSYWEQNKPLITSYEYLCKIDVLGEKSTLFSAIMSGSQAVMSRLLLHPNLLQKVALESELKNCIRWILDSCPGEDVGEEEVLLACFKLNPDVMISLPDNITSNEVLTGVSSKRSSISERRDFRRSHQSLSSGNSIRDGLALLEALTPYSDDPLPTVSRTRQLPNWNERRVSIVPTKLSLEYYSSSTASDTENPEIKFLSFEFDQLKPHSDSATNDEIFVDPKRIGSIGDLYSEHEKLYSSVDSTTSNSQPVKKKVNESAAGSFQVSANTATSLLSQQLNAEVQIDAGKDIPAQFSGSAIDFYQRELLIMKNEVEFTSFMKNLNRLNYVKLKLQLNRALKDAAKKESSKSVLTTANEWMLLEKTLKSNRSEYEAASTEFAAEKSELLQAIKRLSKRAESLQLALVEAQAELADTKKVLQTYLEKLQVSEELRVSLSNQLKHALEQAREVKQVIPPEQATVIPPSKVLLSQAETEQVQLLADVSILKEQLNRAHLDCEKARDELEVASRNYDNELRLLKLNIGEKVRDQMEEYERKFQELNRIIVKFQSSLNEKDLLIIQLSQPNPIQIPRISNLNPLDTFHDDWDNHRGRSYVVEPESMPWEFQFMDKRMNSFCSLSLLFTPLASTSHPPQDTTLGSNLRTDSPNNIPIVKDRGDCQ